MAESFSRLQPNKQAQVKKKVNPEAKHKFLWNTEGAPEVFKSFAI